MSETLKWIPGPSTVVMLPIQIGSVLSRTPSTVPPTATVSEAARRLRDPAVPVVVVADDDDRPVGVVAESDVVALVAESRTNPQVEAIMSTPVVAVDPARPTREAVDLMRERGVRTLVLVEDGRYVGVVTRSDLAPHVSRHRLDVEWRGDPLCVDDSTASNAPVAE